ncbi:glutathione S-transferase U19-like [Pecten maximus]|uniref:glutathione S-transferase U19-like n=1 Tax=Pecten maximus TaxID=6579 RepID=UPI0014584E8C|nr:glutathione S-transferase U19-like [Pecten maximus]XP_033752255.1 glutathione S-transferase U19-like [Pecten maximus]XP_033752256.1 glutathione S-transferase U19-like [Pecten maximus]
MSSLKLYCAWFCPFAQRAWIAFLEKGIPFQYVEINSYEKPPELMAVNPNGLVPVIVLENGKSVFESAVCIQYVDELGPEGKQILPKDPFERAQVRMWSDFISSKLVPPFYRMLAAQETEQQEKIKLTLLEDLATFSDAIDNDGPFFSGKTFGMVDIMLCPFTLRFGPVLKHFRDFEVPDTDRYQKLHKWMAACHSHPSVVPTIAEKTKITAVYRYYAENLSKAETAAAVKQLSGL